VNQIPCKATPFFALLLMQQVLQNEHAVASSAHATKHPRSGVKQSE